MGQHGHAIRSKASLCYCVSLFLTKGKGKHLCISLRFLPELPDMWSALPDVPNVWWAPWESLYAHHMAIDRQRSHNRSMVVGTDSPPAWDRLDVSKSGALTLLGPGLSAYIVGRRGIRRVRRDILPVHRLHICR